MLHKTAFVLTIMINRWLAKHNNQGDNKMIKILCSKCFKEEVLKDKGAVLVCFGAKWCGACKVMEPIIKTLEERNSNTLKVCYVDIDENIELANMYHVHNIPTFVLFDNGMKIDKIIGTTTIEKLEQLLK